RRAARDREWRRRTAAEQARLGVLVTAQRRRIAEELNAVVLDELRRVAALAAGLRAAVAAADAGQVTRPDDDGTAAAAEVGKAARPEGAGAAADVAKAARADGAGAADPAGAEAEEAARPTLA